MLWSSVLNSAKSLRKTAFRMLHVTAIPALVDNYMYLLKDTETNEAVIVDPVEPKKVLEVVGREGVRLKGVLTTHHHWDHAGGNEELVGEVKGLPVYGGDSRVNALTKKVEHGDKFKVGSLDVECLSTPCHTSGHICYHVKDNKGSQVVFTGDTLFVAGCGRFFEGTPQQMYEALVVKLGSLADETKVYVGHEYTVKNLQFARTVEPSNEDVKNKLKWAEDMRKKHEFTIPSTIGDEKKTNPFMRVHCETIQQSCGTQNPVEAMGVLRKKKDSF